MHCHSISRTLRKLTVPGGQMDGLHAQTQVEIGLFVVRPSIKHYNQPYVYVSERVGNFLNQAFHVHPHEFARKLEGFCISGAQRKVIYLFSSIPFNLGLFF